MHVDGMIFLSAKVTPSPKIVRWTYKRHFITFNYFLKQNIDLLKISCNCKSADVNFLISSYIDLENSELLHLVFFDEEATSEWVILLYSHFHLDHCGGLPYMTEMVGYNGPLYMTHPTKAICPILLVSATWQCFKWIQFIFIRLYG